MTKMIDLTGYCTGMCNEINNIIRCWFDPLAIKWRMQELLGVDTVCTDIYKLTNRLIEKRHQHSIHGGRGIRDIGEGE